MKFGLVTIKTDGIWEMIRPAPSDIAGESGAYYARFRFNSRKSIEHAASQVGATSDELRQILDELKPIFD